MEIFLQYFILDNPCLISCISKCQKLEHIGNNISLPVLLRINEILHLDFFLFIYIVYLFVPVIYITFQNLSLIAHGPLKLPMIHSGKIKLYI